MRRFSHGKPAMRRVVRAHLLCSALLVSIWLGYSGSELNAAEPPPSLPLGSVIESVACLADASQTYAIYLPSAYTAERKWPILYAFDARARGAVPVTLFATAAERLGIIVVGSNNSRNGPLPPIAAAMDAIWRDTHARFVLDPGRIYTTGMSGGNLPALQLAANFGSGAIACAGATRPEDFNPRDRAFAIVCTAGTADFNFTANSRLVEALDARGLVARLSVFEGGHGWPPENVATNALEFLHLSAMRAGRASIDDSFVEDYSGRAQERARQLSEVGDMNGAAAEYASLARELNGLRPTEGFAAEGKRLHETPEAKSNRKAEEARAALFERQTAELHQLRRLIELGRGFAPVRSLPAGQMGGAGEDGDAPATGDAVPTAAQEIESHIKRLVLETDSDKPDVRTVARRVLDWFYIDTWVFAQDSRERKAYAVAIELYGLCARMRPKTVTPVYELARTYAAKGDRKRALAQLDKASALGFTDVARLDSELEWASVRKDPRFIKIVGAIRVASSAGK